MDKAEKSLKAVNPSRVSICPQRHVLHPRNSAAPVPEDQSPADQVLLDLQRKIGLKMATEVLMIQLSELGLASCRAVRLLAWRAAVFPGVFQHE